MHGRRNGERKPPEGRGGAGRTLKAANTARTDAGLRARGRTGLGDCQSKGWPWGWERSGALAEPVLPCRSDSAEARVRDAARLQVTSVSATIAFHGCSGGEKQDSTRKGNVTHRSRNAAGLDVRSGCLNTGKGVDGQSVRRQKQVGDAGSTVCQRRDPLKRRQLCKPVTY